MKYLLVLGFGCEVYRREPRAELFINDHLIDQFYIPKHKLRDTTYYAQVLSELGLDISVPNISTPHEEKKKISTRLHYQPVKQEKINAFNIKNLPPLKFYKIEINQPQDQLTIRIDIDNNDNNYTNGFITKSTLLQLQIFYLFPLEEKLLKRLEKIMKKNKLNENYAWYRRYYNHFFKISRSTHWHGKNGQTFNTRNGYPLELHQTGGSGYFICKLVKKYGIFITKFIKPYRYRYNHSIVNYLFDKYQQHENQRNTD